MAFRRRRSFRRGRGRRSFRRSRRRFGGRGLRIGHRM